MVFLESDGVVFRNLTANGLFPLLGDPPDGWIVGALGGNRFGRGGDNPFCFRKGEFFTLFALHVLEMELVGDGTSPLDIGCCVSSPWDEAALSKRCANFDEDEPDCRGVVATDGEEVPLY